METTRALTVYGGERPGLVTLARVRATCPACGQQVEAVASDGRVRGYCTVARRRVDFVVGGDADYRTRMSQAIKQRWQDPDYRARLSQASKKRQQDPDYRARMSQAIKQRWQDPDYRARMSQALKKR